ncbi:MAG: lysophospholipid acyltransferase family protein [Peptostreptococcales bacterium]
MLKNIFFVMYFYYHIIGLTSDFQNIRRLKAKGEKQEHQKHIHLLEHKFGSALIKRAGITVNVQGLENIPSEAVLFVGNHQGNFDIPALCMTINRQFGFIVKKEMKKIPLFNKWISQIESLYLDRENPRESLKTIQEGIELLKNGYSLTIFPEGTRSKSATMGDFKKGSLRLATKSKAPVVPFTINGSYKAFEETGKVRPATIDIVIHQPIYTKDMSKEELEHLSDKVEQIIRDCLNEMNSN